MLRGSLSLFALVALPLHAQQLTGFRPGAAASQAALEARLQSVVDTAWARLHARALAARPHVAGTPAQRATADHVMRQMASWGLDTSRSQYRVFLPFHDSTVVEVITPAGVERLDLVEPPIAADPTTSEPAWPAMNGYSGAGDVTAPVVYVNYGLPADYARLDSLGVSVRGKVVLVRYGRSFRGIKPREAALRGAVAAILYSDPMDDGFLQGEVYPDGPMRNPDGVQRGSIFNGQGDPSTPGWASLPEARRLPESAMGLPSIPVVPIGYGNAARLLRAMGGPEVPSGWQGGLRFPYHLGGERVRVRVAVWPERGERAYKEIANTFGIIRGASRPDELVIVGAHRDAWSPGALDNVSGTVSVLEAARAWAAAVRDGLRPARTLVFATWDAEEWGLIGSSEWVEEHGDSLAAATVAYINQDVIASGRMFGASGTASLHDLVRDVTRGVRQPGDTVSVHRDWSRRTTTSSRPQPPLGDLGGGSDFMGFYNHLGIPSVNFGFGGPGGSYHSGYDTWTFVERFADPGYLSHAAAARLVAVLMARLANAAVVPFEPADLGSYLGALVTRTREEPGADGIGSALDSLAVAAQGLSAAGLELRRLRESALAGDHPPEAFDSANALLRQVERRLLRAEGLPGRPFLRNLVFASDRDNGYANVQFPAIVEALRDGDAAGARAAAHELTGKVREATAIVARAAAALPR